MTVNMRDLPS